MGGLGFEPLTWRITKDVAIVGYHLNPKNCGSLLIMYLDICLLKIVVNAFCSHFHACGELWWKHCELLVGINHLLVDVLYPPVKLVILLSTWDFL